MIGGILGRRGALGLLVCFAVLLGLDQTCSGQVFRGVRRAINRRWNHHREAPKEARAEQVAEDIDWLENVIETYGSIVPKHPDVWGESRLTRHRLEFEEQISSRFAADKFNETIQASIRRSDQSLLALSFALNAASEGASPPQNTAIGLIGEAGIRREDNATAFDSTKISNAGALQLALEPTVSNAQLERYFNQLNQIRRLNEGDDTSDTPGYSLNLIRLPISVLPGHQTRHGYGADLTVTARPILGDELLPRTFQDLVVNDIVDLNALPLTQELNECREEGLPCEVPLAKRLSDTEELAGYFFTTEPAVDRIITDFRRTLDVYRAEPHPGVQNHIKFIEDRLEYLRQRIHQLLVVDRAKSEGKYLIPASKDQVVLARNEEVGDKIADLRIDVEELARVMRTVFAHPIGVRHKAKVIVQFAGQEPREVCVYVALPLPEEVGDLIDKSPGEGALYLRVEATAAMKATGALGKLAEILQDSMLRYSNQVSLDLSALDAFGDVGYAGAYGLPSRSKRSQQPLPPSQYLEVYGFATLYPILNDMIRQLRRSPVNTENFVHLTDVRRLLEEELRAAYDYLAAPEGAGVWEFAGRELALLIRSRQAEAVRARRRAFYDSLPPGLRTSTTGALCWAVVVEASLLNELMLESMREHAAAKGCECGGGDFLPLFLPEPPPEAQEAFRQYVRCRWPIIVYALDPVTEDQNVLDRFSQRRELQVALSVAVATGEISPSAAARFVRRLESDLDTIALNRTAVAYSHGNETFGWRFYPRVQTPPTPSNLGALVETLTGGPSRAKQQCQRRLEPAVRECTAVVIMPSFVPYVTLESRASWFKLNNPRHKALTVEEALRVSRTYQATSNALESLPISGCYRPEDLVQLRTVVDQMESRLPLQQMTLQVPNENNLGGFRMLASGKTELTPDLFGWYGAPGIPRGKETVLFLVGENFSVLETRVIGGGRLLGSKLLSREIVQVTIPREIQTTHDGRIDVHLATPYGVTRHLLIPVVETEKPEPPPAVVDFLWNPSELPLVAVYDQKTVGKPIPYAPQQKLRITAPRKLDDIVKVALFVTEDLATAQGVRRFTWADDELDFRYDPDQQLLVLDDVGKLTELLQAGLKVRRGAVGLTNGAQLKFRVFANLIAKKTATPVQNALELNVRLQAKPAPQQAAGPAPPAPQPGEGTSSVRRFRAPAVVPAAAIQQPETLRPR